MPRITKGSTNVSRYVMLVDSADGTPETGYTITDLDLQYTRNGATPAAKVDATALGSVNAAHADNQAIEVDGTSSPGLYRVDWPDAAFAAGVDNVQLVVSGSGLHPAVEEIELDGLGYLVDKAVAGANIIDDSIIASLVSKSATADWDSFDNTADALEALSDRLTSTLNAVNAQIASLLAEEIESEGTYSLQEVLQILFSVVAGRVSVAGNTATFRTPNNNAVRAVVTVNASDERTAVTLTP